MFFLDLLNLLLVIFMQVFHSLNVLGNGNFFAVNSILMLSMEISLLSQFFPSRFSLISDDVSVFKLNLHFFNFSSQLCIFVFTVSYQSYRYIMKSAFFLKLMPFLLENIQSLIHFEFLHEISNKIINNNISTHSFWNCFSNSSSSPRGILSCKCLFLLLSFGFKSNKII